MTDAWLQPTALSHKTAQPALLRSVRSKPIVIGQLCPETLVALISTTFAVGLLFANLSVVQTPGI